MNIAIAGAGIGGLTTALCLHEMGFQVKVFEAVGTIRPLGVGINLMPHASEVLHRLGLAEVLQAVAVRTRCIEYRTKYGHLIQSDPRNVAAGFSAPQYSIHRGDLQMILLDAARERLGAQTVEAGKSVAGFSQTSSGVTVQFDDGGTYVCDLLIGADGLHSNVRRQLHPHEGPINYEGTMMFRGALEMDPIGDGRTMVIAGNHDVKFCDLPDQRKSPQTGSCPDQLGG